MEKKKSNITEYGKTEEVDDISVIKRQLESTTNIILQDMEQYENDEDKKAVLLAHLENVGVPTEAGVKALEDVENGSVPSDIIQGMSKHIFTQIVNVALKKYKVEGLVGLRTDFINGAVEMFYNDMGSVDFETDAYDPVTIEDFNGKGNGVAVEVFYPNFKIHTKAKMILAYGNDFMRSPAQFVALTANYYKLIRRPIEKTFAIMTLKMLANWQYDFAGEKLSKPTPVVIDKKFTASSYADLIQQLNVFMDTISNPLVENASIRESWKVNGLSEQIEIATRNPKIMISKQLVAKLGTKLLANAFNMKQLDFEANMVTYNREAQFEKLGGVTGLTDNTMFIISEGWGGFSMMYDITRELPTPKAFNIIHEYLKTGIWVDKSAVTLTIDFEVADESTLGEVVKVQVTNKVDVGNVDFVGEVNNVKNVEKLPAGAQEVLNELEKNK